jgi:hypothetical protein
MYTLRDDPLIFIVSRSVTSARHCQYININFKTMRETEAKSLLVFWVVTPCGLVGRLQRFGATYCLHLQGVFTALRTIMNTASQFAKINVLSVCQQPCYLSPVYQLDTHATGFIYGD